MKLGVARNGLSLRMDAPPVDSGAGHGGVLLCSKKTDRTMRARLGIGSVHVNGRAGVPMDI